jgi:hypothetical protein
LDTKGLEKDSSLVQQWEQFDVLSLRDDGLAVLTTEIPKELSMSHAGCLWLAIGYNDALGHEGWVSSRALKLLRSMKSRIRRCCRPPSLRSPTKIDLRMPHLSGDRLFPDWDGAVARLRAAARALKLDNAIVYVPVIGPLDLSL